MALARPGFAERLALIATAARSQPWTIAFNESQRMAIEADGTFGAEDGEAGKRGMRVSRSVGLLSYGARRPTTRRSRKTTTCTRWRLPGHHLSAVSGRQALSPLRRLFLLPTDAGFRLAQRGPLPGRRRERALDDPVSGDDRRISSDMLFPVSEQVFLYRHIPNSRLRLIDSPFGHDGFLSSTIS